MKTVKILSIAAIFIVTTANISGMDKQDKRERNRLRKSIIGAIGAIRGFTEDLKSEVSDWAADHGESPVSTSSRCPSIVDLTDIESDEKGIIQPGSGFYVDTAPKPIKTPRPSNRPVAPAPLSVTNPIKPISLPKKPARKSCPPSSAPSRDTDHAVTSSSSCDVDFNVMRNKWKEIQTLKEATRKIELLVQVKEYELRQHLKSDGIVYSNEESIYNNDFEKEECFIIVPGAQPAPSTTEDASSSIESSSKIFILSNASQMNLNFGLLNEKEEIIASGRLNSLDVKDIKINENREQKLKLVIQNIPSKSSANSRGNDIAILDDKDISWDTQTIRISIVNGSIKICEIE